MLIQIRSKQKNITNQTFQASLNISQQQIYPQSDDLNQDFNVLGLNEYHQPNNNNAVNEQMIVVENSKKKQIVVNLKKNTINKVKKYIETPQIVLEQLKYKQTEQNPSCRICLEQDSLDKLLSPCDCDGTIKYIHMDCLKTWLLSKFSIDNLIDSKAKCELCNTFLQCQFTFSNKLICQKLLQMSRSQKLFFIIFPIVTLTLFVLGIYFIVQITKQNKDQYAYIFGACICVPTFFILAYLFITMLLDQARVKFVNTWAILNKEIRNDTDSSIKPLKIRTRSQSQPQIYTNDRIQTQIIGKTILKYIQNQQIN